MDTQEPTNESVDIVDRKALLEQQFDEAQDQPEAVEFEAATPDPEFEEIEAEPEEEPVWKRPPSSWKRDYHELWQTADPRLQEYAYRREEEMRAGIEPLLPKAQLADQFQKAIEPYMPTLQSLNVNPTEAVAGLMHADHILRHSPLEQKRAYLSQLAYQYGINLGDGYVAPQGAAIDPMVFTLQNELNSVRSEVNNWKQQQEEVQNQALMSEINSFATVADYFEEARPTMIQLLQSGVANTLEDAYNKAIRLDESLFAQIQKGQQAQADAEKRESANRAAKAAKAAAVSVRSSTPGTRTVTKAQDRRSMLLEQLDNMAERF